jgi:UDP-N-acetylmuramate dehydrogenase
MMARPKESASLIAQLPPVRGRLTENAPIGRQTWFGVGGSAEVMFRPADAEDLAAFLALLPAGIPMTVIGVGSNLLVRDGGIAGVTVRLGRGFASIDIKHDEVRVGAGALDRIVAFAAAKAGLAGLEFLSGIPGTIGGSLRMNAGAYGSEVRDVLVSATALDETGRRHTIDCDGMQLSYRHCGVDPCWIFIEARLRGAANDRDIIRRQLAEIRASREAAQPVRARTGGSTFANPPGEAAWRLIDAAGCRGLVRGGAMVSEKHANFLINMGNATAADLEGLGEEVRYRVYEARGILLEWEICRIGISGSRDRPDRRALPGSVTHCPSRRPTPPSPGSERRSLFPPIGPYFYSARFPLFRLLQQLQFVDVVKNSADPRSNEFAS